MITRSSSIDLPEAPRAPDAAVPLAKVRTLREIERDAIRATLTSFRDNVTQTAAALGISRGTLYAKIEEYRIPLGRPGKRNREDG